MTSTVIVGGMIIVICWWKYLPL